MTTLESLYAAIVAQPAEDTPRLEYADALRETGNPDDEARAEFIRLQFELHHYPPRPRELSGVLRTAGAGYFACGVSEEDTFKIGQRVDYYPTNGGRARHGLRIVRNEPDDPALGTRILTMVSDADSKPWDDRKHAELSGAVRDIFNQHVHKWVGGHDVVGTMCPVATVGFAYEPYATADLTWRRGFVFRAGLPGSRWERHGDALITEFPLESVWFVGESPGFTYKEITESHCVRLDMAGTVDVPMSDFLAHDQLPQKVLSCRWPTIPRDGWGNVGSLGTRLTQLRGRLLHAGRDFLQPPGTE